jgi:hypothetical protein
MARRVVAGLAATFLALVVAAPVSADPPVGVGPPSERVVLRDASYVDDSCGVPYDVVERSQTTYWFEPGTDWVMRQAGNVAQTYTNPATGTSIEIHFGGTATWYLNLDPSPARQIQLIGRMLEPDEVLYRYHLGVHWGVRSSDGRTLAFQSYGESNYLVWSHLLGMDTWSMWPEPIGGGSLQRMTDIADPCEAMAIWLS